MLAGPNPTISAGVPLPPGELPSKTYMKSAELVKSSPPVETVVNSVFSGEKLLKSTIPALAIDKVPRTRSVIRPRAVGTMGRSYFGRWSGVKD
jgi:hypothetical protein